MGQRGQRRIEKRSIDQKSIDLYVADGGSEDALAHAVDSILLSEVNGEIDSEWDMSATSIEDVRSGALAAIGADAFAEAFGIHYDEHEILRVGDKERARDSHRWELDPASSEDYLVRIRGLRTARPSNRFLR
jgi:hypothetical protein